MGVVNTKSNIVTNADATPPTRTSVNLRHGRLREQVATVEVAAADDDTSVFRLFRAHTSWRISEILLYNDALTGGTSFDLGAHKTAKDGGAVIDVDAFGAAIDLSSARTTAGPLNALTEAMNIDKIEKMLWEVLGLTSDPDIEVDITLTANTIGSGAGTISAVMRYVAND